MTLAATARFWPDQLGPLARHTAGVPAAEDVSRTRTVRTGTSCSAVVAGAVGAVVGAAQAGVVTGLPSKNDVQPRAPSHVSEMWMWLRWQYVSYAGVARAGLLWQSNSSDQPVVP